MLSKIYHFLFSITLFIALDLVWFKLISGSFFLERMQDLVNVVDGSMVIDYNSAFVVYLLLAAGVIFLVKPDSHLKASKVFASGLVLGLVSYGVYDFTNHATLKNWPGELMAVDIAWGCFSCATVSLSTFYFSKVTS